jgi:hypothetical protein
MKPLPPAFDIEITSDFINQKNAGETHVDYNQPELSREEDQISSQQKFLHDNIPEHQLIASWL